ncbi:MAG: NAD(+)/NADH kinase [Actinomycetota bacterium]
MKLGFVVHGGRKAAVDASKELRNWAEDRGLETGLLEDAEAVGEGLDLVVSVGGDGTLLRAALIGARTDVPVLGVKVGRLGFLTEVDPPDAPALLDDWLNGREVEEEERMALSADAEGAPWSESQWALNEVIVEKTARHRVIRLAAEVNEEHFMTFSADGVIVATPTGSTAYSFSARGPIVSPRLECLVMVPVSAHMVFDRPIVLAPEEQVTLEVMEEEAGFLSADGRPGLELPVGSRVRVRRADRPARLLRRKRSESFFSLLRDKFSLPPDPMEVD